ARPTGEDIERLFDKLERIAEKNNREGRGATVGRRLYVYVAGHGFAPRLKQAAIFTAPATRDKTLNFWATSWVEALYARRWFEEYVLWMDCCMSFELSAVASPAPYRETQATGTPPKLFTAFAARRPQEAVEKQMPDGQVHGVFTWTLLQGLNGAAADDDGTITTAGLKNYLSNAMRTWLSEEELADDRIAQEPDFGSEDLIVLAGGESPTEFNAELKFESALVGRPFVVLDGDLKQIAAGDAAGATTLQLRPGMYAVVVDGTTRQFEVLSDVRVSVG
ncbi:MAG TPA: hypothetical protein VHK06_07960, partial [Candidatus Limnocylindria bacterium]|nr:hypothetical protein [Candidatus Limnocylindria bacterium]